MFTTDRRPQFQLVLEAVLPKVYFQPPSNVTMEYPCIVYELAPGRSEYANNMPYMYVQQYEVKLIGRSPQPEKFHQLAFLPRSKHSHSYVAENLNHDVFLIYF